MGPGPCIFKSTPGNSKHIPTASDSASTEENQPERNNRSEFEGQSETSVSLKAHSQVDVGGVGVDVDLSGVSVCLCIFGRVGEGISTVAS